MPPRDLTSPLRDFSLPNQKYRFAEGLRVANFEKGVCSRAGNIRNNAVGSGDRRCDGSLPFFYLFVACPGGSRYRIKVRLSDSLLQLGQEITMILSCHSQVTLRVSLFTAHINCRRQP